MKFVRKKFFIIIALVIVFFGAGAYLQISHPLWLSGINPWRKTPSLQKLDLNHFSNLKPTPVPIKMSQIPSMNISLRYPANIKLTQINPQLISLSDPSNKADDTNTLYIYSVTISENIIDFKIPFTIPGPLKHSTIIKLREFTANQETYSDGKNEVNLLVLRGKDQTIVLRIPQNSKHLAETISLVVNSIQTLN